MMSPSSIIAELRRVIDGLEGALPEQDISFARESIEYAEPGLALSFICTQIYEYEVPLRQETYYVIQRLGYAMQMSADEWEMLQELISP